MGKNQYVIPCSNGCVVKGAGKNLCRPVDKNLGGNNYE